MTQPADQLEKLAEATHDYYQNALRIRFDGPKAMLSNDPRSPRECARTLGVDRKTANLLASSFDNTYEMGGNTFRFKPLGNDHYEMSVSPTIVSHKLPADLWEKKLDHIYGHLVPALADPHFRFTLMEIDKMAKEGRDGIIRAAWLLRIYDEALAHLNIAAREGIVGFRRELDLISRDLWMVDMPQELRGLQSDLHTYPREMAVRMGQNGATLRALLEPTSLLTEDNPIVQDSKFRPDVTFQWVAKEMDHIERDVDNSVGLIAGLHKRFKKEVVIEKPKIEVLQ